MPKQIIHTTKAPAPIGPYSQAVKAGDILFVSGQVAIDPETNEVISGTIEEETHRVMKNLEAVLTEAKVTFEHVVKTDIFLSDMSYFPQVNQVYGSYFTGDYPARATVAVKTLPKNVNVEIGVTATVSL
ncbi:2-iminobutanoate/2-iminopropanoate deaminase [Filimonas zeae]|uniref:Reactive intermediate/imine deaminase n=1 Tax=Filimonas zeae TaxID=1737353 RepID=A0A917J4R7_9BACT|nr:RidA family protein [Filimonas zeae]MDR6341106.1 2-iminobutanoate/2-iminopropanoate deaminase [Filimonas zeae]GGH77204.1 reactive intermediate/imine deaminase [Filimonas zeae]